MAPFRFERCHGDGDGGEEGGQTIGMSGHTASRGSAPSGPSH